MPFSNKLSATISLGGEYDDGVKSQLTIFSHRLAIQTMQ